MPELRQLRYLLALSECGTFARAAQREHITQSALSQQVARLEREWGVQLFHRTARGTRLTAAGTRLLPQVRGVLSALTALDGTAADLAAGATGELVVGSPTYAVRSRSRRRLLDAFAEGHPGVSVSFRNAWSPQLLERLVGGELDLAFAMLAPDDGLTRLLAQDDPALVVLRADDPLAARAVVSLADLAGRSVLVYPAEVNAWLHDRQSAPLREARAEVLGLREASLPAVLEQVRSGAGVFPAVPWEMDFVSPAALDGLVVRPSSGEPGLRYSLWLARRPGPGTPAAEAFWAVASTVLPAPDDR